MRRALLLPCLLGLACAAAPRAAARKPPLPHVASVQVTAATRVGEASLREDTADAVAAALRARRCLQSVGPETAETDLRVHVHFEELRAETEFGASLAETVDPQASPDVRESRTARVRATFRVALLELPGERKLGERRITVDVRRSPRGLEEDAESAARQEALEQIADRVAGAACKTAAKASAR
jgi:hypothetical protein